MSCGSGNIRAVILNIVENGGNVNEKAFTAASDYVKTQTEPIKTEISNQTISIGIVTIWMLAFMIIFITIIFVFWICYELSVSTWLMLLIIFSVIVTALVAGYVAILAVENTTDTIVQNSIDELITLDNPQTRNIIFTTVNTAASEYLAAIGETCIPS